MEDDVLGGKDVLSGSVVAEYMPHAARCELRGGGRIRVATPFNDKPACVGNGNVVGLACDSTDDVRAAHDASVSVTSMATKRVSSTWVMPPDGIEPPRAAARATLAASGADDAINAPNIGYCVFRPKSLWQMWRAVSKVCGRLTNLRYTVTMMPQVSGNTVKRS